MRKKQTKKEKGLLNLLKLVMTVAISVLVIFTVVQAGTITPPSGEPSAQFYTLTDIYNRLNDNSTASESGHLFTFADALSGTHYTLTQIYDKIPTIVANTVKLDTTYLGVDGTLVPSGTAEEADCLDGKTFYSGDSWTQKTGNITNCASEGGNTCYANTGYWTAFDKDGDNASSAQAAVGGVNFFTAPTGFYDGDDRVSATDAQVAALDADITGGNILSTANIFGVPGTYDASYLSIANVRYGKSFGVSSTGTMSSYPNTPSGISGLNQTVCTDASWTWVADSNYDDVNDDPICVQPDREASGATKVWNTSVANDNTFIGNYGCSGDTDGDGVGTLNTTLTGTVSENAGYGDDAATALAITDCKDGIRNLLSKAAVEAHGYAVPDTSCTAPDYDDCYNGPLTPKVLLEWKGTRLPSYNDFFGVCGNTTVSTTWGQYGIQIGRTDNVITANAGSWEWLSGQRSNDSARLAGYYACAGFNNTSVTTAHGLRAVFRP